MPDYGDKKGFQGSGKGQAATGGQKKGQGGGYNAPGPQYGGSLADTQNKLGTQYSPELAAAITASNKAAFDKKTQRDFINRMADLEASSGQKKSFGQGLKNFGQGIGQGIQKFGQGIMQNITPGRMLASTIGSTLFGPIGGIIAGLLANRATTDAFKKDVGDTIDFGKQLGGNLKTDFLDTVDFFADGFDNVVGSGVPNVADLNTTTQIGDTFTMPPPSGVAGTQVFGNMPRVTSAPIGRVTTPTNAVDLFGNPVVSDAYNIDPMIQTESLASPTTMDILGAEGLLNTPVIDEVRTLGGQSFDDGAGNFEQFNMPVLEPSPNFDPQGPGIITPFDLQYFNYMNTKPTVV